MPRPFPELAGIARPGFFRVQVQYVNRRDVSYGTASLPCSHGAMFSGASGLLARLRDRKGGDSPANLIPLWLRSSNRQATVKSSRQSVLSSVPQ